MSTITEEQRRSIAEFVGSHHIPSGLGTEEGACSIAAINLCLTGELKDDIPACMSPVIGRWIIGVQDAMPDDMRNSARWKTLLPLAAGTGRELEAERSALILDWMWGTVLTELQPLAEKGGYGDAWRAMTTLRTPAAAAAEAAWAAAAARAAARAAAWAAEAAEAAWAAEAAEAAEAARAARAAAWAAAWAAEAAAAARAAEAAEAARAARAAAWAAVRDPRAEAWAEAREARAEAWAEAWAKFDPCGLLERLILAEAA